MLQGKTILITGGTGSFGQKCTQLLLNEHAPQKVIVFSRDELKQHEMRLLYGDDPRIRFFIGDVRDRRRLERAFQGVDLVIHAAALKHVPVCEYNPFEAINTNIMGGQNVIDAALECGVEKVIALSTDKATAPINLYGATKLVAEKLFVQANSYRGTTGAKFSCVRYGNVIGSRGSVVPVFYEQKAKGKLTITDDRMTRFWVTLEQGVRFVLGSVDRMFGGELFVPKLPSMKILELAKAIGPECEIEAIGVRPGEKLHESLISVDEARQTVEFDDFFVICPAHAWWDISKWSDGQKLADGFSYTSDANETWLTADDMLNMIKEN